jgi:hypothetical protein
MAVAAGSIPYVSGTPAHRSAATGVAHVIFTARA